MEQNKLQQDFLEIYNELSDAIFKHCFFRVSNREAALDLTQDTFTKTWDFVSKGNDIHDVRAFVYRVANNLIIDFYRKKKSQSLDAYLEEVGDIADTHNQENTLHRAELSEILLKVRLLEEPYRQAVVMRYVDGLSPKEIAEILKEQPNTISVRISRGVQQLQTLYEK